jgi:hypothetical protein
MGLLLDGRWQEIDDALKHQQSAAGTALSVLCPSSLIYISKDSPAAFVFCFFVFYLGIPVELPDTSFIIHLQRRNN